MLELARLVDDPDLAQRLEAAYGNMVKILALEIDERETISRALDDPPPGLEELRGVLLREHVWRQREGFDSDRHRYIGHSLGSTRTQLVRCVPMVLNGGLILRRRRGTWHACSYASL